MTAKGNGRAPAAFYFADPVIINKSVVSIDHAALGSCPFSA